jgi:16S rRNA (cytidine1402-2'-O)-methyltransferase
LEQLSEASKHRLVVFFEAPHKVRRTLEDLVLLVKRPIIIGREITKVHEEFVSGTPSELLAKFDAPQGEFTVLVPPVDPADEAPVEVTDDSVVVLFGQITELRQSGSKRDIARETGERLGLTARQVYDIIERNK